MEHPGPFAGWFTTQWYRRDAIGELAQLAINDQDYQTTWDFEQTRKYVLQESEKGKPGSSTNVLPILHQAQEEYERLTNVARVALVDGYAVLAECKRAGHSVRLIQTPEGIQLGVTGHAVTAAKGDLQKAFPKDLYDRFLLRRNTLIQILAANPEAGQ